MKNNLPVAMGKWRKFLDDLSAEDRIRYNNNVAQASFFAGLTLGKLEEHFTGADGNEYSHQTGRLIGD